MACCVHANGFVRSKRTPACRCSNMSRAPFCGKIPFLHLLPRHPRTPPKGIDFPAGIGIAFSAPLAFFRSVGCVASAMLSLALVLCACCIHAFFSRFAKPTTWRRLLRAQFRCRKPGARCSPMPSTVRTTTTPTTRRRALPPTWHRLRMPSHRFVLWCTRIPHPGPWRGSSTCHRYVLRHGACLRCAGCPCPLRCA